MVNLKRFKLIAVLLIFCLVFELSGQAFASSPKRRPMDVSSLFNKPKKSEMWLGLGITAASCFMPAAFAPAGSRMSALSNASGNFAQGAFTSEISKAAMNLAIDKWNFNKDAAHVFGYGVTGLISGISTVGKDQTAFTLKNPGTIGKFWNNHDWLRGAIGGVMRGSVLGGTNLLAYNAIKETGFYENNQLLGNQLCSLAGSAAGYVGANYIMGDLMGMRTSIDVRIDEKKADTGKFRDKTYIDWKNSGAEIVDYGGNKYLRISNDVFGSGIFNSAKMAFADPVLQNSLISQSIGMATEYTAKEIGIKGNKLQGISALGNMFGGIAGARLTGGLIGDAAKMGLYSGISSVALNSLGGRFDSKTGKNKWGLSQIQMASVNWLGTASIYAIAGAFSPEAKSTGIGAWGIFKTKLNDFAVNYTSWGGTAPAFTKGSTGWASAQYIQKMADFGGYANFKANADYAMKTGGYTSWKKFVGDDNLKSLFPKIENSLVRYAASSLQSGAVDNLGDVVGMGISKAYNTVKSAFEKKGSKGDRVFSPEKKLIIRKFLEDRLREGKPPVFFKDGEEEFKQKDAQELMDGVEAMDEGQGTISFVGNPEDLDARIDNVRNIIDDLAQNEAGELLVVPSDLGTVEEGLDKTTATVEEQVSSKTLSHSTDQADQIFIIDAKEQPELWGKLAAYFESLSPAGYSIDTPEIIHINPRTCVLEFSQGWKMIDVNTGKEVKEYIFGPDGEISDYYPGLYELTGADDDEKFSEISQGIRSLIFPQKVATAGSAVKSPIPAGASNKIYNFRQPSPTAYRNLKPDPNQKIDVAAGNTIIEGVEVISTGWEGEQRVVEFLLPDEEKTRVTHIISEDKSMDEPKFSPRDVSGYLRNLGKNPAGANKISSGAPNSSGKLTYEEGIKIGDKVEPFSNESAKSEWANSHSASFWKKLWRVPQALTLGILPTLMNDENRLAGKLKGDNPGWFTAWVDSDYLGGGSITGKMFGYKTPKVELYKKPIIALPAPREPIKPVVNMENINEMINDSNKYLADDLSFVKFPFAAEKRGIGMGPKPDNPKRLYDFLEEIIAGNAIISPKEAKSKNEKIHKSNGADVIRVLAKIINKAEDFKIVLSDLIASARGELDKNKEYGPFCQQIVKEIQGRMGVSADRRIGQGTVKILKMDQLPKKPQSVKLASNIVPEEIKTPLVKADTRLGGDNVQIFTFDKTGKDGEPLTFVPDSIQRFDERTISPEDRNKYLLLPLNLKEIPKNILYIVPEGIKTPLDIGDLEIMPDKKESAQNQKESALEILKYTNKPLGELRKILPDLPTYLSGDIKQIVRVPGKDITVVKADTRLGGDNVQIFTFDKTGKVIASCKVDENRAYGRVIPNPH